MNIHKCLFLSWILISGCASINDEKYQTQRTLQQFKTVEEAASYIDKHTSIHQKLRTHQNRHGELLEEVLVTGMRASLAEPSITNTQEKGVDEGGIVKKIGNYIIVLRQGKLYSVNIGDQESSPLVKVDEQPVSPPNWGLDCWFDELLVHGDRIVVVGYSYEAESAISIFFNLSKTGEIVFSDAYLVPSTDYYDTQNYASRLIDGHMVMMIRGGDYNDDIKKMLAPKIVRIDRAGKPIEDYPLFSTNEIFKPIQFDVSLESITLAICPLDTVPFHCSAKTLIGSDFSDFYISPEYAYVWGESSYWGVDLEQVPLSAFRHAFDDFEYTGTPSSLSLLYRIPLWIEGVGAVRMEGSVINQFSFSEREGDIFVVASKDELVADRVTKCKAYWARVPSENFEREGQVDEGFYNSSDSIHWFADNITGFTENRFIDNHLLYTETHYSSSASHSTIYSIDLDSGRLQSTEQDGAVEQIHPIGANALLLCEEDQAIPMISFHLQGSLSVGDRFDLPMSELTESRSQGFFYKPFEAGGVAGIPVMSQAMEDDYKRVDGEAFQALPTTDMFYLGIDPDLQLYQAGELKGDREVQWVSQEDCDVSCYDWYGSARPFFVGNRIFALLKNELVEGYFSGGRVYERQRVNIAQ